MNNACQNDFRISDTGYIPDSYEEEGLHRISVGNVLKKNDTNAKHFVDIQQEKMNCS